MAPQHSRPSSRIRQVLNPGGRLHSHLQTGQARCDGNRNTPRTDPLWARVRSIQADFYQEIPGSSGSVHRQIARTRRHGDLEIARRDGVCSLTLRPVHSTPDLVDIQKSSSRLHTGMDPSLDGHCIRNRTLPLHHLRRPPLRRNRHGHLQIAPPPRPLTQPHLRQHPRQTPRKARHPLSRRHRSHQHPRTGNVPRLRLRPHRR